MSIIVNTNIAALQAQRSLAESSRQLAIAMKRLSLGKKLGSGTNDAAGLAMAERLSARLGGVNMATKNANDGLALLALVEHAIDHVISQVQRMRELAMRAANDTMAAVDRDSLQAEIDSLVADVNQTAKTTVYDRRPLLDGTVGGQFQVGSDSGHTISFSISSMDAAALGINALDLADSTTSSAALTSLDNALEHISSDRARYGALTNRLEQAVFNLLHVAELTAAAKSRIEDADFAAESARLAKAKVMQQMGIALLAQANASTQLAIQLLRWSMHLTKNIIAESSMAPQERSQLYTENSQAVIGPAKRQ